MLASGVVVSTGAARRLWPPPAFTVVAHEPPGVTLERYLDRFAERDWQSTEDGTVRFALVGLGWWVREEVLPALEDADLCEATVLVSSSAEKAESVADRADVAAGRSQAFISPSELFDEFVTTYLLRRVVSGRIGHPARHPIHGPQ